MAINESTCYLAIIASANASYFQFLVSLNLVRQSYYSVSTRR